MRIFRLSSPWHIELISVHWEILLLSLSLITRKVQAVPFQVVSSPFLHQLSFNDSLLFMASLLSLFHRDSRKRLWSEYESDSCFDDAIESDLDHGCPTPTKRLKLPDYPTTRCESVKENQVTDHSIRRSFGDRIRGRARKRDPLLIDLRANNVKQSRPVSVPIRYRISSSSTPNVLNVWRRRPPRSLQSAETSKRSTESAINPIIRSMRSERKFEALPSLRNMRISGESKPEPFDFQKLLNSLSAEYEHDREVMEFRDLAARIEKLNINLTPKQIEEIVHEEEKMQEMVERMKALNLEVPEDKERRRELEELLQRLSRLTISGTGIESDDDEFDVASSDDDEVTGKKCSDWSSMTNLKSIVYKCTKFMLSILMIGAPILYHYVY